MDQDEILAMCEKIQALSAAIEQLKHLKKEKVDTVDAETQTDNIVKINAKTQAQTSYTCCTCEEAKTTRNTTSNVNKTLKSQIATHSNIHTSNKTVIPKLLEIECKTRKRHRSRSVERTSKKRCQSPVTIYNRLLNSHISCRHVIMDKLAALSKFERDARDGLLTKMDLLLTYENKHKVELLDKLKFIFTSNDNNKLEMLDKLNSMFSSNKLLDEIRLLSKINLTNKIEILNEMKATSNVIKLLSENIDKLNNTNNKSEYVLEYIKDLQNKYCPLYADYIEFVNYMVITRYSYDGYRQNICNRGMCSDKAHCYYLHENFTEVQMFGAYNAAYNGVL